MQIDTRHRFRRMLGAAERFEESWRRQNEENFRYYDGDQWTAEEMQALRLRGQPPVVVNMVGAMIDMVRSLQINSRVDVQVVGREESDDAMATLLTALLKQVFDLANFDYYVSKAFTDALIGGRGWLKVDVRADERGKDQIMVDYVPWEQVYVDPYSIKPDATDARYVIRVKWVDRDVLKLLFPDAADIIDARFVDSSYKGQEYEAQMNASDRGIGKFYDHRTQRVKVCECWYSVPVKKKAKRGRDQLRGDGTYIGHEIHHVVFSDDIILQGSSDNDSSNPNTLKVDVYPLIPLVCDTDRHGHPKGMVFGMIGLQDEINKLNSKLVHKFGTRQVMVEASAVQDPEELRQEIQRPDGMAVLQDGGLSRVKVDYNTEDMGFITNHMTFALQMLQRGTGVNDSTLGIGGTNERSGTIQSARIAQGNTLHTPKLENINFCKQRIAYVVLRLIGAYYTDYRVLRVTRPNGETESYAFNEPQPPGGNGVLHKIDDTLDYDVILKKVAPYDSIRDRQLTIFSEVLKSGVIPQEIAAEILLSLADIPNREEILRRIQEFAMQKTDMAQQQQAMDMAQQQQAMDIAAAEAQGLAEQ